MSNWIGNTAWMLAASVSSIIILGLLPLAATAQSVDGRMPSSTTDAYGNARPQYRGRRAVGRFQNETQYSALRSRQDFGRRQDRRGGFSPFSLPADRRPFGQSGARSFLPNPLSTGSVPGGPVSSFSRYGGFNAGRGAAGQARDPSTVFARRYALIAKNSFDAPIYRALARSGRAGVAGLGSTIGQTPFFRPNEPMEKSTEQPVEYWLRTGVNDAHERVRGEAWAWFRAGRYRRAARAFETAVLLDSSDAEARIGELFAHLSVGALRTAAAVLAELVHRNLNPFLANLKMSEAFGGPGDRRRIRIQLGSDDTSSGQDPDVRAMRAVVQWYLGSREDAFKQATRLAHDDPRGDYADWPQAMRQAQTSPHANPGGAHP